MKISRIALGAMLASACVSNYAFGQQGQYRTAAYGADQAGNIAPAGFLGGCDTCDDGCSDSCDSGCGIGGGLRFRGLGGCDDSCDMGDCGMGGCDGLLGGGLLGSGCCLGEPWSLFSGNSCRALQIGGWTNVGYYNNDTNYSFNNYGDRVQLHQQWLYAEKVADGSKGFDLGARMDYLYGTDGPDTQAFGIPNNHWDNSWDNGGAYGHAIPQLYGEVAMGDLSTKVGKFFTIIGNEVVAATGNFFASRQLTFYNAEPFTHTGILSSYQLDDCTTLFGGYAMGWDSGFEDNGDLYLSGFSRQMTDDLSFSYSSALGRFGENGFTSFLGRAAMGGNERGAIHSAILTAALTDNLTYVAQNDYLFTNDAAGLGLRNTFGSIHYLIYQLNDCWAVGSRSEWFNISSEAAGIRNADVYNQTFGVNYRPTANLILRPEVRWVWDKEGLGFNENNATSQTSFGLDGVFTF